MQEMLPEHSDIARHYTMPASTRANIDLGSTLGRSIGENLCFDCNRSHLRHTHFVCTCLPAVGARTREVVSELPKWRTHISPYRFVGHASSHGRSCHGSALAAYVGLRDCLHVRQLTTGPDPPHCLSHPLSYEAPQPAEAATAAEPLPARMHRSNQAVCVQPATSAQPSAHLLYKGGDLFGGLLAAPPSAQRSTDALRDKT